MLAWFRPLELDGPLDAARWMGLYSIAALVVLGLPLALVAMLIAAVPAWRRQQSCAELSLQILALVLASAFLVDRGIADYVLFKRSLASPSGARASMVLVTALAVAVLLGRRFSPRRSATVHSAWAGAAAGVLLLACPLTVLALQPRPTSGALTAPNVVLVVLDTVRADEFYRALGDEAMAPRLAELAAEGTVFSNLHATATWTLPTHGSMFTGLAPRSHGARRPDYFLGEDRVTLAQLLGSSGYATACISNNPWVIEERGILRGFESIWNPSSASPAMGPWLRRVAIRYQWLARDQGDGNPRGDDKNSHRSIELARTWIDRRGAEPFFLFLNLMNAHLPYLPPAPYPQTFAPDLVGDPRRLGHNGGPLDPELDPDRAHGLRQLYRASIAYMDEVVGELVDHLRAQGVLDETVFIVTSDHGEDLGEHRVLGHNGPPWRTTTWVPMILRFPPRIEVGARNVRLASQVDLLPTLLELLGLEELEGDLPYALHGQSLLDDGPVRDWVVSECVRTTAREDGWPEGSTQAAALVCDDVRLLWVEGVGFQLLADDGQGGERVLTDAGAIEALSAALEAWRNDTPTLTPRGATPFSEDERASLRALGYLDAENNPAPH